MARTSPQEPAPPFAAAEQIATHVPEMMLAMGRLQASVFDACLRQNIEMLMFLKDRFERDRALVASLAKVDSTEDGVRAWNAFLTHAAADYAAEPRRLAAVMTEAMSTALMQARRDAGALSERTEATAV